ncbi:hypothetical protein DFQ14_102295 [Halopolyspora algeriensis]|uniref:Uncharacterized protein n=1 Tax=Halopolyspora algeriensis TaxID=1500506 RepID=A0A368VVX7_9ACTN|nr:hypothetical protein DFQ14_102295 [Halopolyspora algeriensis]TQM55406.1 hypothetical protein FHU43_0169 [Halopolyspora algeriensis]
MPAFFTTVLTGVAAAVVEALLVRLAKATLARVTVNGPA